MSISYLDIPPTYINKKDKQVYYYRRRTNSDGTFNKYVYIHDNEKHQIIAWLNRFVVDITAKQVVDHTFCEVLFERTKELPVSKVSKKRNSYITLAAGIVSNIMRNPAANVI